MVGGERVENELQKVEVNDIWVGRSLVRFLWGGGRVREKRSSKEASGGVGKGTGGCAEIIPGWATEAKDTERERGSPSR